MSMAVKRLMSLTKFDMKRLYVISKYIEAESLDHARRIEKNYRPQEIYLYQGTALLSSVKDQVSKIGFNHKNETTKRKRHPKKYS